ncbi:hypothetical protein QBC37DRAFT_343255 [Rhypophila decipiens]|uniref:Uncharacterized protein n=1 Tax=Rhypophila decipiens TaxID=261697 RepID=A0AAN7BAG1_9PEZI|nr:hypothetical protein QBC37DRAFT_343255 [Rhypophila decipiens]
MSLQVAAGAGSLVALGIGAGDIASIISLGRRVGNWWTARSGDLEMLALLGEDGSSILKRRGILDIFAFNKRWRKHIRLLANGTPLCLNEKNINNVVNNIEDLLQELPLFTCIMVCLVAVLEQFADRRLVQTLLHNVLKALLRLHADGEEILRSQYTSRINGWRSTACIRGLTNRAEHCRMSLVQEGSIQSGHIPAMESKHLEDFLVWLLSTNDASFKTGSSDVAGIAFCLADLGMDILHVHGAGFSEERHEGTCSVVYSEEPFFQNPSSAETGAARSLARSLSITIPINHPWECISVFPIGIQLQNQCRGAWKEGQKAAKAVKIGIVCKETASGEKTRIAARPRQDIQYAIIDGGEPADRTTPEINIIAVNYGLVMNQELLDGLQNNNCLGSIPPDLISWVNESTESNTYAAVTGGIAAPEMQDERKITAFCIFQAFFMGYYYDVFGRLIDTSSLSLQTVEGAWGFRSEDLLRRMRFSFLRGVVTSPINTMPNVRLLSRRGMLDILAMFFMGSSETILNDERYKPSGCMGIIGRRTMLINSLLGKCASPREIAGFTLLDVDVGGIPRDHNGLVMAGENIPSRGTDMLDQRAVASRAQMGLGERSTDVDATFNVEADWDGNPDSALVCVRYKGRRITTLSPMVADSHFCKRYTTPQPLPSQTASATVPVSGRSCLDQGLEVDLATIMRQDSELPTSPIREVPVLVQTLDRPRLRYACAALYHDTLSFCAVATDCVQRAHKDAIAGSSKKAVPIVLIAGMTDHTGNVPPVRARTEPAEIDVYEITGPR